MEWFITQDIKKTWDGSLYIITESGIENDMYNYIFVSIPKNGVSQVFTSDKQFGTIERALKDARKNLIKVKKNKFMKKEEEE